MRSRSTSSERDFREQLAATAAAAAAGATLREISAAGSELAALPARARRKRVRDVLRASRPASSDLAAVHRASAQIKALEGGRKP